MQNSSEHASIEAIDIPLWIEADRVRDWRARVARDRAIAADLGVMTVHPKRTCTRLVARAGTG